MPDKNILAPDGKVIAFPDSMSDDDISGAMQKQYPKENIVTGEGMMKPSPTPTPSELQRAIRMSNQEDQFNQLRSQPSPAQSIASDVGQGNIAKAGHTLLSTAGKAYLPLAVPAMAAAPAATLVGAAGSGLGSYLASGGAKALGLSPDQTDLAGDIGGIAGGIGGGAAGGALRVPWIRGAARNVLLDPVTGEPTTTAGTFLKRVLRTPEEAEGIAATAKGPNIPISESPNYPQLAAARSAAMKFAREDVPLGQSVSLSKSPNVNAGKTAQNLLEQSSPTFPKPLRPLIGTPEDWAAYEQQMNILRPEASDAGTYHAARGASSKKTNLQERMGKKFTLPWTPQQ